MLYLKNKIINKMQRENEILNNLIEFLNYTIKENKIYSDINHDIRGFACQFEPEIKVIIRSFVEEIEEILYNENEIEDVKMEEEDEEIMEITNILDKKKIIIKLYELKNFVESEIINFEKRNKRTWSML